MGPHSGDEVRLAERLLMNELVTLKHLGPIREEIVFVLSIRAAFALIKPFDLLYCCCGAFSNLLLSDEAGDRQ